MRKLWRARLMPAVLMLGMVAGCPPESTEAADGGSVRIKAVEGAFFFEDTQKDPGEENVKEAPETKNEAESKDAQSSSASGSAESAEVSGGTESIGTAGVTENTAGEDQSTESAADTGSTQGTSARSVTDVNQERESGKEKPKTKKKLNGIYKKNNRIYYYKNGVAVSGWRKIKGRIYYFNAGSSEKKRYAKTGFSKINGGRYFFNTAGVMKTGWKTIGRKRYYFAAKGALGKKGKAFVGVHRIKKKWRIFNEKGVLKKKTFTMNNTTYFVRKNCLEAYQKGKDYYRPSGKKMTEAQRMDYTTLQHARDVVAETVTDSMSKEEKLRACFDWVIHHPYVIHREFKQVETWPSTYADDHFVLGSGDCHADAAAFAYLARVLGYENVYVCIDSTGEKDTHAWAEINGNAYDPLFAEAKSFSRNYNAPYGVYRLHPAMKLRVAQGYK